MSKIQGWDRATAKQAADVIVAALKAAGLEGTMGVSLRYAGGTYGSDTFTVKVALTLAEPSPAAAAARAQDAALLNLPADVVGRTFTAQGTEYKVTGLNIGRPRFPVSADRVRDGKAFKFPVDAVRRGMGLPAVNRWGQPA
jgi:hypothetical protein